MKLRSPEGTALVNLALSLVFMIGLAVAAYFVAQEQRSTDRRVRRTQAIVSHVTQLQQLALDAESTGRAYLLTGKADVLRSYDEILPLIDHELDALGPLMASERAADADLALLRQRIAKRFVYLSQLTRLRQAQGVAAAVARASAGIGSAEMMQIRGVLTEIKNAQNAQLREYLGQRERVVIELWLITMGCVVAGVALALWVYRQARIANAARQARERQKDYLARHDALTGLANRRYLQDRLQEQIAHAHRQEAAVVLMYLDLDGFKEVNDTLGHDAGDELLKDVARRLHGALRESDVVARLGGDEFVVSLAHLHTAADADFVAAKLIEVIGAPYPLEAGDAHVTVSIGMATVPRDGASPKALLAGADRALYAAKTAGKNRYRRAGAAERQPAAY